MKKRLLFLTFVIILLAFTSCAKATPNESSAEPSSDSQSNLQDYMVGHCSKDSVAEFMSVFDVHESGGYVLDEKHCYNVTPDRIAKETSAQIFKFSDSCAAYIYLNGQIYPLGEWWGGYGFVNAVPCDFDHDGNTDILYTYSCGSGVHRSFVAVFNTQTMESTVIFNSSDKDNPLADLYVSVQYPDTDIPYAEKPACFVVYTVNIEVLKGNFANLGCVATGIVGSVDSEDGNPVFRQTNTKNTLIGE